MDDVVHATTAYAEKVRPGGWRAVRAASWLAALVGAIQLVGLPAAQAAGALYVDKTMSTCDDRGSGSSTAPYCTIAKAMSQLQPGMTLYVGNGTYAETITFPVSGTADAAITVTAWPDKRPVVGSGVTHGVSASNRSYLEVSGLLVTGTSGSGISVSGGSHVSVVDNEVTHAGQPVSGKTAPGIYLSGTSSGLVQGNRTHDNSSHGILLTGGTTGMTVAGNVSTGNAEVYRRNANGIDVLSPGNAILANVTHDNEDSGINIYPGGDNSLVADNVTYDNGDHGIDDLNVTGGRLIGNTAYRNCTTGINVEGTSGHYLVENNVAVDNAVYPAYKGISCSRRAGNIGIWDSAPPTTTVDHNLVYLTTSGKPMYVFGTSYTSLAAMTAATGQERHGVQGAPLFADASAWDLSLTAGSPAIDRANSGASGEQPADVLGHPRIDDPYTANTYAEGPRPYDDIGAYEFQPPPSGPQAPTARLAVTPTSGTVPLAVTADASASTDPQGQVLSYRFDFGDGTVVGPQSGATAAHTYGAAGTFTVMVTVTDSSGLSSTASQTVTATASATADPTFVGTIANNYSTTTHTSGYITVWKAAGVRAGDLVVLTVQLSGTASSGTVSGTDTAGNVYVADATVSDGAGNRLVVLSGVAVKPLAANDKITVSFPSAATYRISGDEFQGATQVDQASVATGGPTAFSSGVIQAASGHELAFGAVSVPAGTANPTWSSGWNGVGTYSTANRYLAKAYEVPPAGAVEASGSASGAWLAIAVTFRA